MSRRTQMALLLLSCAGLSLSCRDSFRASKEALSDAQSPAPAVPVDEAAGASGSRGFLATDASPVVLASTTPELAFGNLTDSITPSMIIRTGQAWIDVDSLDSAISAVHTMAGRVGGFIANTTIQSGEGQRHAATLEIKIPSVNYEQAMGGLDAIGKLRSSTTTAADVGEEYVDVNARMSNARRLEERLVNLLANRTGKLDDVLAVERELARVREEIERYEGRLRYLHTQLAMSTLTVNLTEPAPIVGEPGHNVLAESFKQAWRNLVTVIANGIELLGGLLPLLVLGVALFFGLRRLRKRPAGAATAPV
jgi:hypothetical protein